MKYLHFFITLIGFSFFISCGSDDDGLSNFAPVIRSQTFTISEDVRDDMTIGQVLAIDYEDDPLAFTITDGDQDLFEIADDGSISLLTGKRLDYETSQQHNILVAVSDSKQTTTAEITIQVTDVKGSVAIDDQYFTVRENLDAGSPIGQVKGTSDNILTFSISTNDNDLFEISQDGLLKLAPGKSLDFDTKTTHLITIAATDGEMTARANVSIIISKASNYNPDAFVTLWRTSTANETIGIPYVSSYSTYYNYNVDWGDGHTDEGVTTEITHDYAQPGVYPVSITGNFPTINFENSEYKKNIISIAQWGKIKWLSMAYGFQGCFNLTYTATDDPDFNETSDFRYMFAAASSFNGDIDDWDMSNASRTDMMFASASAFNQDLNNWDMSSVKNMSSMFANATSFNGNISSWNVSDVFNMSNMFNQAFSFNGDLSQWDVSQVKDMSDMFRSAYLFNSDISSWDLSSLEEMQGMFSNCISFNQDLSQWDVSNVTSMKQLFSSAIKFNQNISAWNVSKVTDFSNMFVQASSFNQNLGSWNISAAKRMKYFFYNTGLATANYDATLKGWTKLPTIPKNIEFAPKEMLYCDEGEAARKILVNNGWTFNGDSKSDACD